MIKLIEGGHFKKKGYYYLFFLNIPTIWINQKTRALTGGEYKTSLVYFPNKISLTSKQDYVKIDISILGFGLGLEIISREKQ